ncbi:hypothetical protein [Methanobrevibacter sp.]|uniref:hypothetical protein n=1 Tax=Methanobrevibacter sp. TaxID=66852 RepID=UPI00386E8BB2
MKLKNSYILLIVFAIFLLISMGSVCANDNVSDAALADDGSDAVLANSTEDTKIETTIVSDNVKINENANNKTIPLDVKDNESTLNNVTKDNFTIKENNKTLNFKYNNSEATITSTLTKGNHTLTITYLGNAFYKNSTKNIILSIFGNYTIESASSINVNQTNKIELPLNITNGVDVKEVPDGNFNVEVSYKDGNDTKKINVTELTYSNGKLMANCKLVENIASYTMAITYNDTECLATKNVTLKKIRCVNITAITSAVDYQEGKFEFKVIDYYNESAVFANKKISITGNLNGTSICWDIKQSGGTISLSTTKYVVTDENGIITIENINFYPGWIISDSDIYSPAGIYNLSISAGDDLSGKLDTTITINKINTKLTVAKLNEYYGTSEKITITALNANSGKVLKGVPIYFKVTSSTGSEITYSTNNNKITTIYTNSNGTVELPVSSLIAGKYNVYALLNGTDNYGKSEVNDKITINAIPIRYEVTAGTMYYNTGNTATIKVISKLNNKPVAGAIVIIQFDNDKNQVYGYQSDANGIVTVKVPLNVGKHSMFIQDGGEGRFTTTPITKNIKVQKASAKISAPKVTAYYKQGKYFTIKLTNTKNKKPIYYAKLNVRVYVTATKYYNYKTVQTGLDGKIKLLVDLKPGKYKVEIRGADSKNFAAKKVTSKITIKKAPTKLIPKKLTAKKGEKKYFKVTVKNKKTKKVIAGVKVKIKVYTGKKFKTYKVKTNKKGIAQLNVKSLKVGKHKVVVTSANKYCVAKAAKSTIKITKK